MRHDAGRCAAVRNSRVPTAVDCNLCYHCVRWVHPNVKLPYFDVWPLKKRLISSSSQRALNNERLGYLLTYGPNSVVASLSNDEARSSRIPYRTNDED